MKIKEQLRLLVLLVSMFYQNLALGQEIGKVEIGTRYKIQSKILNEERVYIVGVPDSYKDGTRSYPVLLVLDGGFRFHSHSGIVDHLVNAGQVPEMIIVVITNVDRVQIYTPTNYLINLNGSDGSVNQRTSGGSEAFTKFIEEELLAEIDKNFRTNSFRVLVGISHGGLLVGSSYLSKDSSFGAYIAMDPSFWWDDQYVVKLIDEVALSNISYKKFYLSTADSFKNFKRIPHVFQANINSHEMFNAKLKNKGVKPSNLKFDYFKKENHWTVALQSLNSGLKFVYEDLYMENFYDSSAKEIIKHYKHRYHGAFLPPERKVNNLGYYNLRRNNEEEALELFKLNVLNYPNSFNAYDSLGEMYKKLGQADKALMNYRKSLKLNPSNENAKQMILLIEE